MRLLLIASSVFALEIALAGNCVAQSFPLGSIIDAIGQAPAVAPAPGPTPGPTDAGSGARRKGQARPAGKGIRQRDGGDGVICYHDRRGLQCGNVNGENG